MPRVAREVHVFVASPGDCDGERGVVRSVATAVTDALGPQLGVRLRVDGWETVTPDYGRPQDLINPLVDECDVFIGLLGNRWGMPTGTHSSGFLEEFERVLVRRVDTSEPQIAVYFRQPPAAMLGDPGRELRKVLAFQQRLRKERVLLYARFTDLADLERKLWPLLSQALVAAGAAAEREAGDDSSAGAAAVPMDMATMELESDQLDQARRQIAEAAQGVANAARGGAGAPVLDGDRFLLIALSLNDDGGFLPTHVGNRLYRRAGDLALSVMERTLWLRSLLADVGRAGEARESRVLPGWATLAVDVAEATASLSDRDDLVARGALEVLSRLGARPSSLWPARGDQKEVVNAATTTWLRLLSAPAVARTAEKYLASLAGQIDVPLLENILAEESLANIEQLRLALAGDLTGLVDVVTTKPYEPGWKVTVLQSKLASAPDDVVTKVALGKNSPGELRSAAGRELKQRDRLSTEVLMALLHGESALVEEVFAWLRDPGASVTIAQVAQAVTDLDDSSTNRSDLIARVHSEISSTSDLLAQLDSDNPRSAWDALEWKSDPELVPVARSIFDRDAEALVAPLADNPEWRDHQDVISYIRARSRLGALRILMRQDTVEKQDLDRLRKEVLGDSMYTRQGALAFLAEHATMDDLPLLLDRLGSTHGETSSTVTAAILRIGGRPAAHELINSGERDQPVTAVRALGQDAETAVGELRELLYAPNDALRLAALDEIIERYNDEDLNRLLIDYLRGRRAYYYNVICELDWILFGPDRTES